MFIPLSLVFTMALMTAMAMTATTIVMSAAALTAVITDVCGDTKALIAYLWFEFLTTVMSVVHDGHDGYDGCFFTWWPFLKITDSFFLLSCHA